MQSDKSQLPTSNNAAPSVTPPPAATPPYLADNTPRRRKLLVAAAVFVVIVVAVLLFNVFSRPQAPAIHSLAHTTVTVRITDSGFVPNDIFIKPGTEVVWTNETQTDQRVASNPYPSHSSLPGLFSSTIAPQATYAYIFEKSGQWGYQNFLHPMVNGSVHVTR